MVSLPMTRQVIRFQRGIISYLSGVSSFVGKLLDTNPTCTRIEKFVMGGIRIVVSVSDNLK
jgi:hypothetical protein